MNKLLIIILYIAFLYSCSNGGNINNVQIEQIESNYPIIIYATKQESSVHTILFPLVYKIRKNNSARMSVIPYGGYFYGNKYSNRGWYSGGRTYLKKDGKLQKDLGYLKKDYKEYVFYERHYNLSKKEAIQQMFQPYIEKMKRENKDSLHIESIQQLKKTNPELVNGFLQGDSIRFDIRFPDARNKKLGQIELPVEVK